MNINKAIEHFQWKFKNSWKPTPKDIEAFNSIIDYKELAESRNLTQNESLAKLWIHQMILLSNTNMYNGERCIQITHEILDKSVYDWCLKLKDEIPMMKVRSNLDSYKNDEEMFVDLKYEISEDNIIKFVKKEISNIILKYEK